jgi:hypothetical protein
LGTASLIGRFSAIKTPAADLGEPLPSGCRFVAAPIKNLVVMEPDKIICPVTRGRN